MVLPEVGLPTESRVLRSDTQLRYRQLPRIGLSYSPSARRIVATHPNIIDYLEVPFELLEQNPQALELVAGRDLVLHCASLSLASSRQVAPAKLERLSYWIEKTGTPWLGEHLAFISAARPAGGGDEYAPGEPYNIGFTVSPPMNTASVETVSQNIRQYARQLSVPILVENSPIYFRLPGSDMNQIEYINRILANCDAGLLLDLTHLYISAKNEGFSVVDAIDHLPLDRVVEIHVSGVEEAEGISWDHHASGIRSEILELLFRLRHLPSLKAVTLEYNWISDYTDDDVIEQIMQVRRATASI
jgi:uncharacterized protein (UPF0276 family)